VIDKQDYYHGAAVLRLLHDERTSTVHPVDGGFLVNDAVFALIKYSTKVSSWRFTFTAAELSAIDRHRADHDVVLVLVCGGDGICAMRWESVEPILDDPPTWIAAKRKFKKRYSVTGSAGEMRGRIPHNRWPGVIFEEGADQDG
jgi:hypothetical protein